MEGPPLSSRALGRILLASIVVATVLICSLTSVKQHFDGHLTKYRLLRELQAAPALRLRFQLKRKSMFVHGASDFDVLAARADSGSSDDSIGYHGVATFQDDEGLAHEYLLADGTAYYSRYNSANTSEPISTGCIPSSQVPPVHTVLNALHDAKRVKLATDSRDIDLCPSPATTWHFNFAGEPFVACAQHSSFGASDGFQIFGSDLDIEVQYAKTGEFAIPTAPELSSSISAQCGKVPDIEAARPSLGSVFTGFARDWSRQLEQADGLLDDLFSSSDSTCSCSGAVRPCVFFAGMGSESDRGLMDSFAYFDGIADHAPCCSSIKFAVLDTTSYGWSDDSLQQRACDLAIEATGSTGPAIKNAIVVSHSMGGLTLAGAFATGKCSLADSSSWVAISTPVIGSMGSNYLQDACAGAITDPVAGIMELIGRCPASAAATALAYQGSSYSFASLSEKFAAAQAAYVANVDAVMCSNSYEGLVSTYQAIYALAGAVIPHQSGENDGMVEFTSCSAGLTATFSDSPASPFYVTALNHIDTSFRNGDGLFDDAKKPLKWFECLL